MSFFKTCESSVEITSIEERLDNIKDYLRLLYKKKEMIIIFADSLKFIGKIKCVLNDSVILEKDKFEEIAIQIHKIIAVRKWTGKD